MVSATEKVKWDSVAFSMKNKKLTPLLMEVADGVKSSSGPAKELKKEIKKLYSNIIKVAHLIDARISPEITKHIFIVRFSGKFQ